MKFADFVCTEAIILELKADDRNKVIEELVIALGKAGKIGKVSCDEIAKVMIKREKEASTGMGKGVAIPHIKHSAVKKPVAAIGQSSTGIDFSALDKQPVFSVVLLISPLNDPDLHLQAMEKIFRSLQQEKFRKWLRQSQTKEDIENLLKDTDEDLLLK